MIREGLGHAIISAVLAHARFRLVCHPGGSDEIWDH